MPNGDGTGPMGRGAMTGRGAGYCAGADSPGYAGGGLGRGLGLGRSGRAGGFGGRGMRNRFNAPAQAGRRWVRRAQTEESMDAPIELAALNRHLEDLQEQMAAVKDRLDGLTAKD